MLTLDVRDFQREARRMDALADQIPYALALALNASAEVARKTDMPAAWGDHMTVRNARFMEASLTTKGRRATKRNLSVVIWDKLNRGNFVLHEKGGTRTARGGALAVPSRAVAGRRTAKGIPAGIRPRAVPRSAKLPSKFGGEVIYQQTGKYRKATGAAQKRAAKTGTRAKGNDGRHLRLMYALRPSVPIRAEMPFHAAFARSVRRSMPNQFRIAMRHAMATARKTK